MKIQRRLDKIIIYPGLSFWGFILFVELLITVAAIISFFNHTLGVAGILFWLIITIIFHFWLKIVVIKGNEITIISFIIPFIRKTFHFEDVDYIYIEGQGSQYAIKFVLKNMRKYYFCTTFLGRERVLILSREVGKIIKCNKVKENV